MRTDAFYGAAASTEAQVEAVHRWLATLLPAARRAIIALQPDLSPQIPPP